MSGGTFTANPALVPAPSVPGASVLENCLEVVLGSWAHWPSPNLVQAFFHLHCVHQSSRCSMP